MYRTLFMRDVKLTILKETEVTDRHWWTGSSDLEEVPFRFRSNRDPGILGSRPCPDPRPNDYTHYDLVPL